MTVLDFIFLASSFARQGPFREDIVNLLPMLNCSDIVMTFLEFLSYFNPFVKTNTGHLFLAFLRFFLTKSIPSELTATTIKSHL